MQKLALTIAASTLFVGLMATATNAQTHQFGSGLHGQNATPIVQQVACRGFGARCGPGFVWACGPYGRCFCRPC